MDTQKIRRHILENPHLESSRAVCVGCGGPLPSRRGCGISRWNPKANLCTPCCELEAFSRVPDPFGLAALPGGRGKACHDGCVNGACVCDPPRGA